MKNFGFSRYADPDVEEEDLEEPEMGIFEGSANMDRDLTRERVLDLLYLK